MSAFGRLLETDPFDFSVENRALFVESMRECAYAHYRGSRAFRAFWEDKGIHPGDIVSEDSLELIPPIMVHLFKEREFLSVRPESIVLTLTSSGTGGEKSQMLLDAVSLERVKALAWKIHEALGLTSDEEVNYLCFTYDPRVADNLGTAFTDELLTSFTGKKKVYYAIQWDEEKKDFFLNVKGVIKTLEEFNREGKPTRILGFPAHLYKIINESALSLDLGDRSFVQTGGGWKGFAGEEVPKNVFRKFISERLSLPVANIRDMFGMVEHGIPYVDCECGNLHIPNYSRVYIRSPVDLSILPPGETGLIHFLASYNMSYPSVSLLTTDWGRIGSCSCRVGGPTLEILGRAGVTKHKGCAISASRFLKG